METQVHMSLKWQLFSCKQPRNVQAETFPDSEDHINKARDSTHEDAHPDKPKRKLVQNSSVKKKIKQTTTKQNKNKTHTKTTL